MHVAFIPYGKMDLVNTLLRDMQAQKHQLWMKKGKKKAYIWIQGNLRNVPLGILEYVCPKEDLDKVLTTFNAESTPYNIPKLYLYALRKILRLKKIPKFEKAQKYLWVKEHVSIIVLGIREDGDIIGKEELDKGWTHEAV